MHTHTHVYIYSHTRTHSHILTYTYTLTHAHTHTYTYTYILLDTIIDEEQFRINKSTTPKKRNFSMVLSNYYKWKAI